MTNPQQNPNLKNPKYDLEERTFIFSKNIIDLIRKLDQNIILKSLTSQLIRSATSIGANYSEADEASSKKDFINKVYIAKKEAKETKYWLRLLSHSCYDFKDEINRLWQEAQELNLIFASIINKCKNKI